MRQTRCGLELSKVILVALATVALASPASAFIGDFHNTLRHYEAHLTGQGWEVRVVYPQQTEWSELVPSEHSVNQLIGAVLRKFSKADADKVSLETKREISRIAREAIAQGLMEGKTNLKTGTTGSVRYRVGISRYTTYYTGRSASQARDKSERIHVDRNERSGLALLIALMPRDRVWRSEAQITVRNVPADAELFFDGEQTKRKGSVRHYTTPELEVGKVYSYKILVRWKKDGKTFERTRTVSMSGDDDIKVDFRIYQGVAR